MTCLRLSGRGDLNPRPQRPELCPGTFVVAAQIAKPQVRGPFGCPMVTAEDRQSPYVCGLFVVCGDGNDFGGCRVAPPWGPSFGFLARTLEDLVETFRH